MNPCGAALNGALLAAVAVPDYRELATWGGVVLLALVVWIVIVVIYRRRYRMWFDPPRRQVWTLEDLQAMRERGELQEAEYARLRDCVLAEMGVHRPDGN
ncbi:MAG: hypothetical protein V2A79_12940 [Planctomycetota bacterium]